MLRFHSVTNEAEGISIGEPSHGGGCLRHKFEANYSSFECRTARDLLITTRCRGLRARTNTGPGRNSSGAKTSSPVYRSCTPPATPAKTFRNQFHHDLLDRHRPELIRLSTTCPAATGTSRQSSRKNGPKVRLEFGRGPLAATPPRSHFRGGAGNGSCDFAGVS